MAIETAFMSGFVNRFRHAVAWLVVVFAYGTAARADDAPPLARYSLGWSVPDSASGCASVHELASAAEAILGKRVFVPVTDAVLFVEGRTELTPGGPYEVKLQIYDRKGVRRGSRRFAKSVTSCRELDQPLALMIALAIDPRSAVGLTGPTQTEAALAGARDPSTPLKTTAIVPPEEVSRHPIPAEPDPARPASAEMALRLGFGVAPHPVLGLATGVLIPLARGPWTARLGATVWMPARVRDDQESGSAAGAWFNAAALRLAGCNERNLTPSLQVIACVGVEPGVLLMQGYGYDHDRGALRPTVDASFALAATVRLSAIRVQLEGALLVPFVRDDFYASNLGKTEIFRRPAVGGLLALGLFF